MGVLSHQNTMKNHVYRFKQINKILAYVDLLKVLPLLSDINKYNFEEYIHQIFLICELVQENCEVELKDIREHYCNKAKNKTAPK